ncbi:MULTISPECIES: nucleoside hydrolase [Brevibacterium]|uniref:Inosine-uridine nucleoside N-ribohydrolase n=3 Tax=Brevibacterium casei TaxID=33889 RepID=K9ATF6_9MICO|nr:nucleoside hydrolase [Brevibacterium casei]NJE65971.1 nucleoside hydrolase [Brevibacterium sp. LS14]EKU49336.1 Inosine-uridine nucleoside N-ribohydrolase [Brevibacterium casei S18]MCT1447140.1 nucleoside hydrolase [Brevibacterium casei]MCT2358605.1 nucleoside hydrolase [Brevibacterium casei]QPR40112.1 nucleoside hydrolase [Brevibacterium casei]
MILPLFLDCDPGIDDAIALGYLLCQDDIDVVGIAASGGNVPTAQVVENTRRWLTLAGRDDIPVHAGDALPLARQRSAATQIPSGSAVGEPDTADIEYADLTHGQTGAGYATLPEPTVPLSATSAAQAWVDAARAHPGRLIGVVIGPSTNLALALAIEPRLPHLLRRLFIMGGAFNYRGNTHPTTEWNVTFDPEALATVLASFDRARSEDPDLALPVIAPIEATEAVAMTPERLAGILDTDADPIWQAWLEQMSEALRFYFEFHDWDGLGYLAHIHDPFVLACALAWARTPDQPADNLPWATTATAPVDVELTGTLTRGETVADWLGRWGRDPNVEIIRTIDADAFLDHLGATLKEGPHHDRPQPNT